MNLELISNRYEVIDGVKILYDFTNKRIKILEFINMSSEVLQKIIDIGVKENIGKIICNCREEYTKYFTQSGFKVEGKIDGFFKGKDAICLSYFIDEKRKVNNNSHKEDLIIEECLRNEKRYLKKDFNYEIRTATKEDIEEIINLFKEVFSTYPSPVYEREFLEKNINDGSVIYKVAIKDNKIMGIASAEMDKKNLNSEMTDCATYPKYRGLGVLSNIIFELEKELKYNKFICLYSLSRAINPSINYVLRKHDYNFRGRLINNCDICGSYEDMNIWVKKI